MMMGFVNILLNHQKVRFVGLILGVYLSKYVKSPDIG
jgi:hypothetical protein